MTTLAELVREAKERNLQLDASSKALLDSDDTDEVQVENAKTVERDVLLTLWDKVARIGLCHYYLQRIDADARKLRDNAKLRLEAYELRRTLCSEIREQIKVAERKLRYSSIDHRKALSLKIKLLRRYVACLKDDIKTAESDDKDVRKAREEEKKEGEHSLSASQRWKRRQLAPRAQKSGADRGPRWTVEEVEALELEAYTVPFRDAGRLRGEELREALRAFCARLLLRRNVNASLPLPNPLLAWTDPATTDVK